MTPSIHIILQYQGLSHPLLDSSGSNTQPQHTNIHANLHTRTYTHANTQQHIYFHTLTYIYPHRKTPLTCTYANPHTSTHMHTNSHQNAHDHTQTNTHSYNMHTQSHTLTCTCPLTHANIHTHANTPTHSFTDTLTYIHIHSHLHMYNLLHTPNFVPGLKPLPSTTGPLPELRGARQEQAPTLEGGADYYNCEVKHRGTRNIPTVCNSICSETGKIPSWRKKVEFTIRQSATLWRRENGNNLSRLEGG